MRAPQLEATVRTILMLLLISVAVRASTPVQEQYERKGPGGSRQDAQIVAGTMDALQTEGLIHTEQVDAARTRMTRLSSQKLSHRRSRQIYYVQFFMRNGENVNAIAVRDESRIAEESGLVVYVVSKTLKPDGKAVPPRH
jgi:hypothetical protein